MAAESWRPTATFEALRLRAALYARLRAFFAERGVLEVETPVLSRAGNTDPNIRSFDTRYRGPESGDDAQRWLRTSPEYPLKRLLAAGLGDCYELGRVFRDGEAGRRHNPEFTMLEWYRVGCDHVALMQEVAELVAAALQLVGRDLRIERTSYRELYRTAFGFDPFSAPIATLRTPLADVSIDGDGLDRDDWLDLLMTHRLQPRFDPGTLLFVQDFPPSQCALARLRGEGEDAVAERFEAYLGAQELANGYHELADAREQRQRFERDRSVRSRRGDAMPRVDEALLAALQAGLPDCAGVALGIERLLMAMLGTGAISDVLAFPFARA
jgi:elongation factor P--(R)-beta-lysine ligase